jgi:uncharacterized integral membrane protein (TIGR00698 family)
LATKSPILLKISFWVLILLSLSPWLSPPFALLLGFIFNHFFSNPYSTHNKDAVNWTLKSAVVGLGFGLSAEKAIAAGSEGFLITIISISTTLLLGWFLGRLLKLNSRSSYLLSSGTAICGGSAIAAIAPIIKANERDISMAMGTVFLLNSIALLIFPFIGEAMSLSQEQFGLWAAIAIHDTSSVVGAAAAYGEVALEIATTVKLARALWIIPLALITARIFKSEGKIKFPYFILLFIAAIILNSYLGFPEFLSDRISQVSRRVLTATLFLVGAGLSVEKIKQAGLASLILGLSLWIFISLSSLAFIFWYH